ncbi:MAG: hypothetical protein JO139_06035 [Alphaproteobacteria bacterium]|nr:hypothetical protein [Alphaproteobacteria bacterium]
MRPFADRAQSFSKHSGCRVKFTGSRACLDSGPVISRVRCCIPLLAGNLQKNIHSRPSTGRNPVRNAFVLKQIPGNSATSLSSGIAGELVMALSFFLSGRMSLYARREASSMQTCKASSRCRDGD